MPSTTRPSASVLHAFITWSLLSGMNSSKQFCRWGLDRISVSPGLALHTLTSRRRCTHRFLILHLFDAQVLQRDDPPGLFVLDKYKNNGSVLEALLGCHDNPSSTHCGVLEVVETVVGEDEPPPLPGFDPSACGAESRRLSSSAREAERDEHRRARSSSGRQTDVRADRQTMALWLLPPEDLLLRSTRSLLKLFSQ